MDLLVNIIEAKDLIAADANGFSDPYVNIRLWNSPDEQKQRTKIIKKTLNPEWNEHFKFKCRDGLETLEFHLWDHDFLSNDSLGEAFLNLSSVHPSTLLVGTDLWVPLTGVKSGRLHVAVKGIPRQGANAFPSFDKPPTNYSVPPLSAAIFIPPPPSYSGSVPYSPSQIITVEVCYKLKVTTFERKIKLHGPSNIITHDFVAACNNLISHIVLKGEAPVLKLKESKKKPTLHWETKISTDFQSTYQDDVLAGFLNLFELWGWRFEKQYDVVQKVVSDGNGNLTKAAENQVFVFRRAIFR
eukprot:Phypoly_transcript_08177.p1 GENE.Phypoly_transcript_08177~~Phypoly_transcript_08177.p1  ORF type:complete len:299 (+),score=44.93 Phypoly_transcript_08177:569-1465(+)